jgi:hypothetical protein
MMDQMAAASSAWAERINIPPALPSSCKISNGLFHPL